MVLVDTSVWVDHFRLGNQRLAALLENGDVVCHPFIIGELACGNLPSRTDTLGCLLDLPRTRTAGQDEVMRLIEGRRLMGIGLGLIDVHLLAAALLDGIPVWTLDIPLKKAAAKLGLAFP
ncbi:MAG: type II toxin-antitoxin system VapC family toxin [Candidatus Aminicenantes bacterium]|nr:type II toxin-antitoxin system VapC family toxin [Candidatus Aminicenantes bacterium]